MSSLSALCQPLSLSFVDADDDYDDFSRYAYFPKLHTQSCSKKDFSK